MSAFLLEIGTEELPASFIVEAERNLHDALIEMLRAGSIKFGAVKIMSTPRRLTALISDLSLIGEATSKRVKGPPVASSFQSDGTPKPAAAGFAAKHKMRVDQLEHEQQGDLTYLVANVISDPRPTAEVLQSELPRIVSRLSGERMMRWGSSEFKFSRPIRWIVSLLDSDVVPFSLNGVAADRLSYGHRILSPGAIALSDPSVYCTRLEAAFVQVDRDKRREKIKTEVVALAGSLNGRPRQLAGALLDEVVNITEWPVAVFGEFSTDYLELPDALIETVMVHHQKYFPVEKLDASNGDGTTPGGGTGLSASTRLSGALLPYFITIANNDKLEARSHIKQGNERVLKARLADGRFFYFDDQKTSLSGRKTAVSQLTFQEGLGNYGDKVARMVRLAELMSEKWKLPATASVPLARTLELCKSDLVTNLVRELPELQGHVGSWYAQKEGQPDEVVQAIASHYAPRFTEDAIPLDKVGQLASVIDKADTLVGLFLMGKKPTGSSDPFALRRQAQGLVDVLIDGLKDVPVALDEFFAAAAHGFKPLVDEMKSSYPYEKTAIALNDFVVQRIKNKLTGSVTRREILDSAIGTSGKLDYLPNIPVRIRAVERLLKSESGMELIRAGVRIGNILKSGGVEKFNPEVLSEDVEKELWSIYQKAFPHSEQTASGLLLSDESCSSVSAGLEQMVPAINRFFEDVMVNDPDMAKRANRRALLQMIYARFNYLADFPTLQPLTS